MGKGKRTIRLWRRAVMADRRTLTIASIIGAVFVLVGATSLYNQYMSNRKIAADYSQLLETIAKGESSGNYNAYYGNAGNTAVRFTDMTVAAVMAWQKSSVDQGSPSSAVGKYQIIRPTLATLVQQLDIAPTAIFDARLQDKFAVALLEKRGAQEYLHQELSRDEFAANLAKEWAALPRVIGGKPDQSYYAGDGLNKSHISVQEIYDALATLHP